MQNTPGGSALLRNRWMIFKRVRAQPAHAADRFALRARGG
jgi:hypothetical protein